MFAKGSFRPRVLRWLLAIMGMLALVAAHAVWDHVESRLLKATVDRIPPQTLLTPGRPDVDPVRDAASYFLAAGDLVPHDRDTALFGTVEGDLHQALVRGSVPDDLRQRARAIIAAYADALRLFDRATTLDFRGFSPGRPGHPLEMNTLARLDGIRAIMSAIDGVPDLAASSIATEIEVEGDAHGLTDAGMLVPRFLTTVANLQIVLTSTTLDEASLARIAAALAVADQDDALAHWFEMRRRLWFSVPDGQDIIGVDYSDVSRADYADFGRGGLFGDNRLTLIERIKHPVVARRLRVLLEYDQAAIDAAHRPWPGRIEAVHDAANLPFREINLVAADLAVVRAARVAVAIERYRRTHGGQMPIDLHQLPASLLDTIPIDPFSGAPIRFRTLASGYVVYSVGLDRQDDGRATTGLEAWMGAWGADAHWHIGVRIAR